MSNPSEESVRIYTGPAMMAKGLTSRLQDIGISPIEKDDHESGIRAGFATGVPGQVRLFIRKDQLAKAQPIIDEFMREIEE